MKTPSVQSVIKCLKAEMGRPCLVASLGRLERNDPHGSAFGAIRVMLDGEKWPRHRGADMIPLLQLNTDDLLYRPDGLEDIAMLRVWVSAETPDEPLAEGFCVRASRAMSGLLESKSPAKDFGLRPHTIRWKREIDLPSYDDLPRSIEEKVAEVVANEQAFTLSQTKIGGYPYPVQMAGPYRPTGTHPHEFKYVLQIGSEPKARWMWGDLGVGFVARHKTRPDQWEVYWECS